MPSKKTTSSKKTQAKKVARPVTSPSKGAKKPTRKVAKKKASTVTPAPVPVTRTHVYLVLDESGSMSGIAAAADQAARTWIGGIKQASSDNKQDTVATVIMFDNTHRVVVDRRPIDKVDVSAITIRRGGGSTALFATTLEALRRARLDLQGNGDSALILVVTDGGENCNYNLRDDVSRAVTEILQTNRVDVALMVPPRQRQSVSDAMGVSVENVREWEPTVAGLARATQTYQASFNAYYGNRSRGITSNRSIGTSFYADPDDLTKVDMAKLTDISREIRLLPVTHRDPERIDEFFVAKLNRPFEKGKLFYELTKSEDLRPGRSIIVQDMQTGKVFGGDEARAVLGLDFSQKVKVRPGKDKKRRVFVQSTSLNRKLVIGTEILLWEGAR
jgi:hypothetical protein